MSKTAYERVKTARSTHRPTGLDYIHGIFENFFELHGDRRYAHRHSSAAQGSRC